MVTRSVPVGDAELPGVLPGQSLPPEELLESLASDPWRKQATTLMSHASTLCRRLGAALLATGLAGGMVLMAPPAEALASQGCVAWNSSGWNYIDSEGNDIYVVQARCSMWLSTGGDVTDEPETDHEIPKGASPAGNESKEEHCEFLKGELAAQRAALAWAQGGLQAAEDELELLTGEGGGSLRRVRPARDP